MKGMLYLLCPFISTRFVDGEGAFFANPSFASDLSSTSWAVNCEPVLAFLAIIFRKLEGVVTIAAGESLLIQIVLGQRVLVDTVLELHPLPSISVWADSAEKFVNRAP